MPRFSSTSRRSARVNPHSPACQAARTRSPAERKISASIRGGSAWNGWPSAIAGNCGRSPRANPSGSMSATANPASAAPARSSTPAALAEKPGAHRGRAQDLRPARPTAALRSASTSARIAASACFGRATATPTLRHRGRLLCRPRFSAAAILVLRGVRCTPGSACRRRRNITRGPLPANLPIGGLTMSGPYETGLDKNAANFVPLSPIGVSAAHGRGLSEPHRRHPRRAALYLAAEPGALPPARLGAGDARDRARRHGGADGAERAGSVRGAFRRADGRRRAERAQHPARRRDDRLHPEAWRGQGADHRHRIRPGDRPRAGAARRRSRWSSTSPTRSGPAASGWARSITRRSSPPAIPISPG